MNKSYHLEGLQDLIKVGRHHPKHLKEIARQAKNNENPKIKYIWLETRADKLT